MGHPDAARERPGGRRDTAAGTATASAAGTPFPEENVPGASNVEVSAREGGGGASGNRGRGRCFTAPDAEAPVGDAQERGAGEAKGGLARAAPAVRVGRRRGTSQPETALLRGTRTKISDGGPSSGTR